MSRPGFAYRSCEKKIRYRTEGEAREAMRNVRHRRGQWTRCYECQECNGGWHITAKQERRNAG